MLKNKLLNIYSILLFNQCVFIMIQKATFKFIVHQSFTLECSYTERNKFLPIAYPILFPPSSVLWPMPPLWQKLLLGHPQHTQLWTLVVLAAWTLGKPLQLLEADLGTLGQGNSGFCASRAWSRRMGMSSALLTLSVDSTSFRVLCSWRRATRGAPFARV